MCVSRRNVVLGASTVAFSCLTSLGAQAQDKEGVDAVEEPVSDVGCGTLDPYEGSLTIIDFSPAEKQNITEFRINDYGAFIFSKRWRKSDGLTPNTGKITLGCYFMNGSISQQRKVIEAARDWLKGDLKKLIDFRFDVPRERSHIRISLGGRVNNSYVGRYNLRITKERVTMNLANFSRRRVVQHEFGHALGLRHEHRFPDAIEFNRDVVIADARARWGWSEAQTERNILDPLSKNAQCIGDPSFNPRSVMIYPIPKTWTRSGKSYGGNNPISNRDRRCLIGVYSA